MMGWQKKPRTADRDRANRRWSDSDMNLLRLLCEREMKLPDLVAVLGRSDRSIITRASQMKLKIKQNGTRKSAPSVGPGGQSSLELVSLNNLKPGDYGPSGFRSGHILTGAELHELSDQEIMEHPFLLIDARKDASPALLGAFDNVVSLNHMLSDIPDKSEVRPIGVRLLKKQISTRQLYVD